MSAHLRGGFLRDNQGLAALEFAIVAPTLLILMLSGLELVNYIKTVRKIELYASSVSEMISQAVPPDNQTTTAEIDKDDIHFAYDSGLVLVPYLMTDAKRKNIPWWQDVIVDFASIQFNQTSTKCSGQVDQSSCYSAKVLWTSTGTNGSNSRPCLLPQKPTTSSIPDPNHLPYNVFGPGSLIAIDVVFQYTPGFGSGLLPSLSIARSVYVQPRYADVINFSILNNDGIVTVCP